MFGKDIKLKPTNYEQYDREYYINDFKTINELESLKNSIIISLMTRLGELNHNPTYNGFGCGAWNYLKSNYSPLTKITIQETIKKSLEKINDVKSVEYVRVEPEMNNPHNLNVFFTITLKNNTTINDKIKLGGI